MVEKVISFYDTSCICEPFQPFLAEMNQALIAYVRLLIPGFYVDVLLAHKGSSKFKFSMTISALVGDADQRWMAALGEPYRHQSM